MQGMIPPDEAEESVQARRLGCDQYWGGHYWD